MVKMVKKIIIIIQPIPGVFMRTQLANIDTMLITANCN